MEKFNNKGDGEHSVKSTEYSMEMGSVGFDSDPNHIHFVSVGRVKDRRVLLSAITNRKYQNLQNDFVDNTSNLLNSASYANQMENKTVSDFKSFRHHTFMDKNFILFTAITSREYPEALANRFLQHLSENLYDADPMEFKRNP